MEAQTKTSTQQVEQAKQNLKSAFESLESALQKRGEAFNNERALRKQISKELDEHIEKLEKILEGHNDA